MFLIIPRKVNIFKAYTLLLWITVFVGTHIFSINIGIKLSLFRALLLFSPFVFFLAQKKYGNSLKNTVNHIYFQFLFLWLIYSILCLLLVSDYYAWMQSFLFLLCGAVSSWFIGVFCNTEKDFIWFCQVVEIFTLFVIITGLYEIITGNYPFVTDERMLYVLDNAEQNSPFGLKIPVSIFNNPNNFAFYTVFSFFISMTLSRLKSSVLGRFFSLIVCSFLFFLLIATQSRSGLIGLILGLFSIFLVFFVNCSANKKVWIICICIFCSLLIGGWLISDKDILFRFIEFHPERRGGGDNIRLNLIKQGLIVLKNKFFLGTGLGNIEYNIAKKGSIDTFGIVNIHNWWFEILVSSGIIIFFLYLYIYVRNLVLLYFGTKKNNVVQSRLAYCFFGFSVAFIVTSMGPSSCMKIEWMWPTIALFMTYSNYITKDIPKY